MNNSDFSTNCVSVLLCVHKNTPLLLRSIESVLHQRGVTVEMIVVGDGDPDGVSEQLAALSDARVRYFPLERCGLTKALVYGYSKAQFDLIARLDVGDVMVIDRLASQAALISSDESIGLVSSAFAFYTREGYYLYQTGGDSHELSYAICNATPQNFKSPMHASVMFTKSAYELAGGYREQFYYAQDCDLWMRILENHQLRHNEMVLTLGEFSATGISGQHPDRQAYYLAQAVTLRELRKQIGKKSDKKNEEKLILELLANTAATDHQNQVCKTSASANGRAQALNKQAAAEYFLARCLMATDSQQADLYFKRALDHDPLMIKARVFSCINRMRAPRIGKKVSDFESNDGSDQLSNEVSNTARLNGE